MSLPTRPSFRRPMRSATPLSDMGFHSLIATHFPDTGRILVDGSVPSAVLVVSLDIDQDEHISDWVRQALSSEEAFDRLSTRARTAMKDVLDEHLPVGIHATIVDRFFTVEIHVPLTVFPEMTQQDIKACAARAEEPLLRLLTPWSVAGEPYLYDEATRRLL